MRASLSSLLLLLPLVAAAPNHGQAHKAGSRRSHSRRSAQSPEQKRDGEIILANSNATTHELAKRQSYSGTGTFYYVDVGYGACGNWGNNNDWTVALNSAQYGSGYPGPHCFQSISISANGKTLSGITIMDECPTCGYGSLDLSPGLFNQFADESAGVISITWWFGGSGSSETTTSKYEAPTSTYVAPTSTSTYVPPTSTSTWSPSPTPTSTWTPEPSTSTWSPPPPSSSSSTWTTSSSDAASSTTSSDMPSSSSSSITSSASSSSSVVSSSASANSTVNPFAIVSSANSTISASRSSTSISASASASAMPVNVSGNNLAGLAELLTYYGQMVVTGANSS